jgi:hypothetical protein
MAYIHPSKRLKTCEETPVSECNSNEDYSYPQKTGNTYLVDRAETALSQFANDIKIRMKARGIPEQFHMSIPFLLVVVFGGTVTKRSRRGQQRRARQGTMTGEEGRFRVVKASTGALLLDGGRWWSSFRNDWGKCRKAEHVRGTNSILVAIVHSLILAGCGINDGWEMSTSCELREVMVGGGKDIIRRMNPAYLV